MVFASKPTSLEILRPFVIPVTGFVYASATAEAIFEVSVGPRCPLKGSDGALTLGLNVAVKIGGKKEVKMMLLQRKLPMALGEVPMALDADGYI